jgi:hypothetical protein
MREFYVKQAGHWMKPDRVTVMAAEEYHQEFISPNIPPPCDLIPCPQGFPEEDWTDYCARMKARIDNTVPPKGLVVVPIGRNTEYKVGPKANSALQRLKTITNLLGIANEDERSSLFTRPDFEAIEQELATPALVEQVVAFVTEYGPLLSDFGDWAMGHSLMSVQSWDDILRGRARFRHGFFGTSWFDYAVRTRMNLDPIDLFVYCNYYGYYQPIWIPCPLGYYLWAAVSLSSLCKRAHLPEDQAFLCQCLHDMPITLKNEDPTGKSRQGEGIQFRGELIHYLALAAWYRRSNDQLPDQYAIRCANLDCQTIFHTHDRRNRYCAECQESQSQNASRQKRWRLNNH